MKIFNFIKKWDFMFIIAGILTMLILFNVSCKSLKVYNIENETSPCNKMYTQMDFDIKKNNKTTTLVTLWQTKCSESLDRKTKEDCKRWIFKDNEIDKKQHQKYSYYLECIAK